jgi:manganese-dependent inorganic pyrophosphatase
MNKKERIYIIGHKNPDTDSICSAIAYADIKNRTEDGNFVAKRAGQINEETEYVLERFGVRVPGYLPDAGTQVKEIDIHEIQGVSGNISVKKAWEMMREENVVTLPITSEDEKLHGIITVSDIAKSYMDAYDSSVMSQAKTKYSSIAETLDGHVIVGNEHGYFVKGRVVIGSFHPDFMEKYIHKSDLVILGNRADDQLCAIEMEASCIVVGLGAKVSKSIQKLAMDHECVIIISPHDTYTIARLINQSIPIKHLMTKENLVTFSTNDFLDDIKDIMKAHRHRDFPVLDKKNQYIGTISRRNLIGSGKKKLILVDHNEKTQAVDNVSEAEILEIIDHHRLGSLETISPILFRNEPVGCSATIIASMFFENGIRPSKKVAGLLSAAIISDTLLFKSPTSTNTDKHILKRLANIADIYPEDFAKQMFKAGSSLDGKTPDEILNQDFKEFILSGTKVGVSQISTMDTDGFETIRHDIIELMENRCANEKFDLMVLMLTNILDGGSELIAAGEKADVVEKAFNINLENNSAYVPGILSRKKQVIPPLTSTLAKD